jgi:hypothetical protein
MRRFLTLCALFGGVSLVACTHAEADATPEATQVPDSVARSQRLEHLLDALADDSMAGRGIGTPGIHMAARFLASELKREGVQPAGDDGYLQHVPVARVVDGRRAFFVLPDEGVAFDTLPPSEVLHDEANVVGLIRGSDPALADQVVVIGAHYDHLGIGRPVNGDSIYNGADDDGSGTVAVLEIARDLARTPPKRTVVVLLSTGEEVGMVGTRWYLRHPVEPLAHTVADLQLEMIGRPDSLAGGPGHAWLTGYERTTMGEEFAAAGSPIVPDPRPDQRFFFRSDNTPFAVAGIPAHTLSSYDLHADYHRPSDEVSRVDFDHMTAVTSAAVQAVRVLADGPKPQWKAGGRKGLGGR